MLNQGSVGLLEGRWGTVGGTRKSAANRYGWKWSGNACICTCMVVLYIRPFGASFVRADWIVYFIFYFSWCFLSNNS